MGKLGIKLMEINISEYIYTPEYFSLLKKKIKGLKISQSLLTPKTKTDLKFLQGIQEKEVLKVLLIDASLDDDSALNNLYLFDNLLELSIVNSSTKPLTLTLGKFPHLKHLSVIGNFELKGLEEIELESLRLIENRFFKFNNCSNTIKNLYIRNVKNFDFQDIGNMFGLKKLTFSRCQLSSLNGIENFKELEELEINYCAKLRDINAIACCSKLRKVELDSCKKIDDFNCLSNMKKLKGLVISNCGNIQSLGFIINMDSLKFLSFVDTNIVDGDLTPCFRLEYVGTTDKRHYNFKSSELPHNKDFMFCKL